MELIIGGAIGLAAGTVVAYLIQVTLLKKRNEQIIKTAELEGEALKKEKILQAEGRPRGNHERPRAPHAVIRR